MRLFAVGLLFLILLGIGYIVSTLQAVPAQAKYVVDLGLGISFVAVSAYILLHGDDSED